MLGQQELVIWEYWISSIALDEQKRENKQTIKHLCKSQCNRKMIITRLDVCQLIDIILFELFTNRRVRQFFEIFFWGDMSVIKLLFLHTNYEITEQIEIGLRFSNLFRPVRDLIIGKSIQSVFFCIIVCGVCKMKPLAS